MIIVESNGKAALSPLAVTSELSKPGSKVMVRSPMRMLTCSFMLRRSLMPRTTFASCQSMV